MRNDFRHPQRNKQTHYEFSFPLDYITNKIKQCDFPWYKPFLNLQICIGCETIFDIPRETNESIMNFLSHWTTSKPRLNNANRPCTNHFLISKFKLATTHDPRAKLFITELKRRYPGNQTWKQLLHLAREQEPNLDGVLDDMRQAISASTILPITNSENRCPPPPSSPMRPKATDNAVVGNTVSIVLSEGTDSI